METVKDINRWWLNPKHRLLDSVECRSLRWRKAFGLCLLGFVQSPRRFSSLDVRLHLPMYFVTQFRECRNDKVSAALPAGMPRCPEETGDMLSGQMPYKGIDRNRKRFLSDDCLRVCQRTCRIVSWEESLIVARRQFVQCTLASPFKNLLKVLWPKSMGNFKSIPIIFSRNLLYLLMLQQFTHKLMGQ